MIRRFSGRIFATARLMGRVVVHESMKLDAKAAVGVGCTVIGDLLEPIGDFTVWFFLAFLTILIGCVVALRSWATRMEKLGKEPTLEPGGPPRGARFLTAISVPGFLLTGLLLALQASSGASETGAIAQQFPAIAELQRQVGLTHRKLDALAGTLQVVEREVSRTKRETSTDPRKELANLGIVWTTEAFVEALMTGDARAVRLFLAGGMSAETSHTGASAVLYILQPNLPDPVPMLELLVAAGYDPDAPLLDTRILPHYGEALPPQFEGPGLPSEYSAWNRTFAGPALLWVAIRASYAGATENDRKVIQFLRSRGASTTLTRSFLEAVRPAWGDTESFKETARLVGG